MNEAKSDYLDPELLSDANPPPAPPASLRPQPAAVPPPESISRSPGSLPTHSPPAMGERGPRSPSEPASDAQKPSWLRALLTTTFPPPAPARQPGVPAPVSAQTAGAVFAALGLVFALVALVTGLRGAPSEPIAPAVAACLVIARAFVALGAGALSFAMFRQAERLLVEEPPTKS
jgi:hypothetical protein